MNQTGKLLFFLGLGLMIIGIILWLFGDRLNFFGKLPGDIRIEKENYSVYIPITTMLLISLIISLILRLWQYLK